MATYSNILAWKIPWTEEPGGLQFMWPQRVRHNRATEYEMQVQMQSVSFKYFLEVVGIKLCLPKLLIF